MVEVQQSIGSLYAWLDQAGVGAGLVLGFVLGHINAVMIFCSAQAGRGD